MEINKTPLELQLEIEMDTKKNIRRVRLTKTVYACFIPQHGMEVLDTEIVFKVKTTALAGLHSLKHNATPLRYGKNNIQGSYRVVSKLHPKDEEQLSESLDYFSKQGWKIDR